VDHAAGFQRDVLLLPCWLGLVLDHQQRFVDCTAMAYQRAYGGTSTIQFTQVLNTNKLKRKPASLDWSAGFF
jgi:hypothetical protein